MFIFFIKQFNYISAWWIMNLHIGPYYGRTMKSLMGFRAVQEWSTCLDAEQTCLARIH